MDTDAVNPLQRDLNCIFVCWPNIPLGRAFEHNYFYRNYVVLINIVSKKNVCTLKFLDGTKQNNRPSQQLIKLQRKQS